MLSDLAQGNYDTQITTTKNALGALTKPLILTKLIFSF